MDPNLFFTHVTAGAACAYLLDLTKRSKKIPWVNDYSKQLNRLIRIALSGFATLGITWAWSSGSTAGSHVLTIVIPPAVVIMHGSWIWFGQYALQHGWGQVLALDNTTQTGLRTPTGEPPKNG